MFSQSNLSKSSLLVLFVVATFFLGGAKAEAAATCGTPLHVDAKVCDSGYLGYTGLQTNGCWQWYCDTVSGSHDNASGLCYACPSNPTISSFYAYPYDVPASGGGDVLYWSSSNDTSCQLGGTGAVVAGPTFGIDVPTNASNSGYGVGFVLPGRQFGLQCYNSTWNTYTTAWYTIQQTVPPPPSGSINSNSCTIPVGGTSCYANVIWSTSNPPAANTTVLRYADGTGLYNGDNGTISRLFSPPGTYTINLYTGDNSINNYPFFGVETKLATGNFIASCVAGSTWNGGSCVVPVACVGSWSNNGTCSVSACGQNGVIQQTYTITTAAANGGAACPYANGATRWGGTSCSTAACTCANGGLSGASCPTGTWTAPSCPSSCSASTPSYYCSGGNGYCSTNSPATKACSATLSGASCPTGTWTAPSCPSSCSASTPSYYCSGGNGYCSTNTPATKACSATLSGGSCPTGTWTAPACPSSCTASNPSYYCSGGNGYCSTNSPATLACSANLPASTCTPTCDNGGAACTCNALPSGGANWNTTVPSSSTWVYRVYKATDPGTSVACTYYCDSTHTWNGATSNCDLKPTDCSLDGTPVLSGYQITAYKSRTATSPITCASISQIRHCTNGSLDGDPTYQYAPPCTDLVPSIASFTVAPMRVHQGGGTEVTIKWSTTDVTSCVVKKSGSTQTWSGISSTGTSDTVTIQTTYTITCDSSLSKSVIVNVVPSYEVF